ncbi:unnamed protein product [Didymodactylos carnosus]|uniref:Methyltransferase FkbM domain-containing protein n=1 Tax=Didymodactylos carnosus TaxID=1234261 RepID=A0A815K8F2_9BILA|nr:unnamed protein product [Didymodactylos carnosus]CAF1389488.1 unnamed protein product [Didymodactylos carnosus]CAF4037679.1 unnamed protein product [Didymodactylos carnosus]CAF4284218.1 unnamed protein product [Didymodactylos carnosus]
MKFATILQYLNKNPATIIKYFDVRLFVRDNKKWILFVSVCVLIQLYTIVIFPIQSNKYQFNEKTDQKLLDGCRYVYIDMGTNIGIQIRKLYEPQLYANAPVLPLFKEIFGNYSNEVCSVGFEANPLHDSYLKEFQTYCLKRGWRVKIFTSTAVSIKDGNVTFHTEPGNEQNNQWGASLVARPNTANITVPSIDVLSWLKSTVLDRKLSPGFLPPRIMMKSDIEGHDSMVLANLILSGLYCSIDLIYGEHLSPQFQDSVSLFQQYSESCKTKLISMDDESYHTARFSFIIQNSTY